jgi:hypothetical protein
MRTRQSHSMIEQEARALLARLQRVKPFVLNEPMLPAAALTPQAQIAIERVLAEGRKELKNRIAAFLEWLRGAGQEATPEEAHRRYVFLRLRFNAVLAQLDLFNQVITQRSETEQGVLLSGLDIVSADALALPAFYEAPPVICYLDRGVGAAIRRARTRLPGGGENPVAVIRVPRERMIGSGVASSLIHEVGHQGAALLDLIASYRPALQAAKARAADPAMWDMWTRWISEIVSDFWSVARIGVVSTIGLMGVVGLPRPFVFRPNFDDPHPTPWVRVKLSCAIGDRLFPNPQWRRLAALWESYYPLDALAPPLRALMRRLEAEMPPFVEMLVAHRPASLRGRTLGEALETRKRTPERLTALFQDWSAQPNRMYRAPPSLAFAVLGQAKAEGRLSPEDEAQLLTRLLTYWAMRSTLDAAANCGASTPVAAPAKPIAPRETRRILANQEEWT